MNSDIAWMRHALALAKRGKSHVHPNPLVGCVLVKNSGIVGQGFHARFGGPHAEIVALSKAGDRARGATAYVTLEPCCHYGKTPPCTQALIKAGLRRVVAATKDPNPLVNGRGLRALKLAGLDVSCGVLEEEAKLLNKAFFAWIRHRRPYVILKAAVSLDGRMETVAGESKWITSKTARRTARRMRENVDAVLVGVGTVLKDNPRLTTTPGKRQPLRIVLDSRLRTPQDSRVLSGTAPTWIATAVSTNGKNSRPSVEYFKIPRSKHGLDLKYLLKRLAEKGIASLLVEGGSRVHTSFLEKGLVDEVRLFIAPRLIGGREARGFFEGRGIPHLHKALSLHDARIHRSGRDFLLSGFLRR